MEFAITGNYSRCELEFGAHLVAAQGKALKFCINLHKVLHKMCHFSSANWGLKPNIRKTLYSLEAKRSDTVKSWLQHTERIYLVCDKVLFSPMTKERL